MLAALAVISVVPLATAVATPVLALIVAVPGVPELQVKVGWLTSATFRTSKASAVNAWVAPIEVSVGVAGLTTM